MMKHTRIFNQCCGESAQRGGMLVELLLSVALVAIILPFIFGYQQRAITRAESIAITHQMENIQSALEKYIIANRQELLTTVGKNITRVALADLGEYGINPDIVANAADKYQLRILKSNDNRGHATLQGVIVMTDPDITPLRTREIVGLGGTQMGFIEGNRAYGTFGAWRADTVDLGLNVRNGIIETTNVNRDNALYLWRIPSTDATDATMMSALNLGNHDIRGAAFFNAAGGQFDETLTLSETVARDVIFQNRTTISNKFTAANASIAGILSSDSRNMEVAGSFNLNDTGKFTSFTVDDLWVGNLTLAGLSIYDDGAASVLKINRALDMTSGRIDAMFITVSFAGSITPRLVVRNRIEDSINPDYFWDADIGIAHFMDMTLMELNHMAPLAVRGERGGDTVAAQDFGAVAANKNATVSDYMNAITEIQNKVRAKYRQLNLD